MVSQQLISEQNSSPQASEILTTDDLYKLTSFFSLLIDIDQRLKRKQRLERDKFNEA